MRSEHVLRPKAPVVVDSGDGLDGPHGHPAALERDPQRAGVERLPLAQDDPARHGDAGLRRYDQAFDGAGNAQGEIRIFHPAIDRASAPDEQPVIPRAELAHPKASVRIGVESVAPFAGQGFPAE